MSKSKLSGLFLCGPRRDAPRDHKFSFSLTHWFFQGTLGLTQSHINALFGLFEVVVVEIVAEVVVEVVPAAVAAPIVLDDVVFKEPLLAINAYSCFIC